MHFPLIVICSPNYAVTSWPFHPSKPAGSYAPTALYVCLSYVKLRSLSCSRPAESDQVIHHRGGNRDQEMQSQPQCRGTPTFLKARVTQQAGRDILEDALRRYLALHRPKRVGVENVKRAGDESAGQDV